MSVRKPLVLGADGLPQQLQSGDSIGVTSEISQFSQTAAAALTAGNPVFTTANDAVNKARANASSTSKVVGLCVADIANAAAGTIQSDGLLTLTTTQWDSITGQTGGLTAGANYFLSAATAGSLTTTAPTTAGQLVLKIGQAISSTSLLLKIGEPVLL